MITLGDLPFKWYASRFGSKRSLREYGIGIQDYGELHDITVAGYNLQLLPLVHVRQAGRRGNHSKKWAELHESWMNSKAVAILG